MSVIVVATTDPGYSHSLDWAAQASGGYLGGPFDYSATVGQSATFAFTLPAPGKYKVAITYVPNTNRSPDAGVVVKDGGTTLLSTTVNMGAAPGDFSYNGSNFKTLSASLTFAGTSGSIIYTVPNDGSPKYTIADAVYLQSLIGPTASPLGMFLSRKRRTLAIGYTLAINSTTPVGGQGTLSVVPSPAGTVLTGTVSLAVTNGTASPTTLTFNGSASQTVAITPSAAGLVTVTPTNDSAYPNPSPATTTAFSPVLSSGGGGDTVILSTGGIAVSGSLSVSAGSISFGGSSSSSPLFTPVSVPNLLAWWDASVNRYSDSPPVTPAAYGDRVRTLVSRAGSGGALAAVADDDAHRMLAVGGGIDGGSGPGLYADDNASGLILRTTLAVTRPYTIVVVGTGGVNAYVRQPMAVGNAALNSQLLGAGLSAYLSGTINGTLPWTTGAAGPRHIFILSCDVSGSTLWIDGADATANGAPTQDFGTLLFNCYGSGALTWSHGLIYGRVLSSPVKTALTNYLRSTTLNLIVDGNSLSIGYPIGLTASWPYLLGNTLAATDPKIHVANVSVSGDTTVQRDAAAATAVDAKYDATAARNVLAMWELTNHIFAAGATQAQAYAAYQTYGNNRMAAHAGLEILLGDCLRRSGNAVTTVNGSLAADFPVATADPYTWKAGTGVTYGKGLLRLSTVPQLADETNLTYFQSDQTHLTLAGYQVVAARFQAALGVL